MTRNARAALAALVLSACAGGLAQHRSDGPDVVGLRLQLARSLIDHREWAAAVAPLLEVQARRAKDPEVHTLLATAYREQDLYDAAAQEYDAALALDGNYADAWGGRGVLRDLRHDAGDAAIADLEHALKIAPESVLHRNNLGFALYLRGRYLDAVTAFREALRRDPSNHRVRNNLGFAYGRLGQVHLARREFEHGGATAEVWNNLGFVYEQLGERASACESYREAVQLAPSLATARAGVNLCCPPATVDAPAAAAARAERRTP